MEKNTQVPLMGRVYTQATSVVIWLGESTPNIDLVIPWMPVLGEAYCSSRTRRVKTINRPELVRMLCGLLEIVSRPYWRRMWTFQEFFLPENDPVAVCGKHCFTAKEVGDSINQLEIKYSDVTEDDFKDPLINASRFCFSSENISEVVGGRHLLQSRKSPRNMPFGICVGQTTRRRCFDQRDYIYALYGLYPKVQAALAPDYGKPVAQVMHETTAFIMNHDLDSLQYVVAAAEFYPNRQHNLDIPSWVFDFGRQSPESDHKYQYCTSRRIAGDICRTSLRASEDTKTLHVRARSLDACRIVLRFEDDVEKLVKQVHQLLGFNRNLNDSLSSGEKVRYDRLTKAVTSHSVYFAMINLDEVKKAIKDPTSTHFGAYNEAFYRRLRGKTLIKVPSIGRYRVTVGDVEEEDIIIVSRELGVPAVLRSEKGAVHDSSDTSPENGGQKDEGFVVGPHRIDSLTISRAATGDWCDLSLESQEKSYRLMGLAYVEGVMDSQSPELLQKINQLNVEEFIVH
ncbi:Nn.00g079320.m01.CDS01 [Neocucurbitaria sp. VM-36]